ncbi:hypothetical protein JW898_05495 [Candidatus Woesearchaeota archaeon]|nr:hypothetical protein [Candidatus Woesearchaeota archaeon]
MGNINVILYHTLENKEYGRIIREARKTDVRRIDDFVNELVLDVPMTSPELDFMVKFYWMKELPILDYTVMPAEASISAETKVNSLYRREEETDVFVLVHPTRRVKHSEEEIEKLKARGKRWLDDHNQKVMRYAVWQEQRMAKRIREEERPDPNYCN